MGEWKKTTIGDQITLQRGVDITRAEQRDGAIPVVSSGGISSFHDTPAAQGPGVVLGRKGVVGSVWYVDCDYWPHDTTLWVKDFKGNNPRFVYYFFKSRAEELASMDTGSANPTLNRNHVHPIEILWPDVPLQERIVDLLGSLDDKIRLLATQVGTLEGIAGMLFAKNFPDADEKNGQPLSDLAVHHKESVIPSSTPSEIFTHFSLPAFDQDLMPSIELGDSILSNKYLVFEKSILMSKLNPKTPRVWPVFDSPYNGVCSTEFQVISPKRSSQFEFVYFFLKSSRVTQELANSASGTSGSHQRVSPGDIFSLELPAASSEKIESYSALVRPLLQKRNKNLNEISTLKKVRDTLLPKLMSGEVRLDA